MNSYQSKRFLLITAVALAILSSCGKNFLDLKPVTETGVGEFYKTASDLGNAVNGAYASLQLTGQYSESYYFLASYPSDNIENTLLAAQYDFDQFDRFYVNPSNIYLGPFWNDNFKGIIRCNNVINKAPEVKMDTVLRNRYVSEAIYLRSLMYFNLVRVFGDVPLVTKEVDIENAYEYGRTPVKDIYSKIIKDLILAQQSLPLSYTGADIGRVTRGAAQALLAEIYLTNHDDEGAVAQLKQVIDSKVYKLLPDYEDVFAPSNGNNAEIVFSVNYKKGGIGEGSPFVNAFLPLGGVGSLIPSGTTGNRMGGSLDLFRAFEPGDARRHISIDTSFVDAQGNEVKAVFTRKYFDIPYADKDGDNDWPVYRYSDVLLMYAEALNESGKTTAALPFLNQVRIRAKLLPKPALNQPEMRLAIEQERRVEFCFEGHRWFDLVRTGRAIPVMDAYFRKYNIENGGKLITVQPFQLIQPVPLEQIQINPSKISQNKGY